MTHREKIILVFFFLAVCVTAAGVHLLDRYRMRQAGPAEIFGAVQEQLAACRGDDFPAAYRHASATLRRQWTPERFAAMVRNDYARTAKARRVEFGAWKCRDTQAVLAVYFTDAYGNVTPCVYSLIAENGQWKIDATRWGKTRPTGLRGIRS